MKLTDFSLLLHRRNQFINQSINLARLVVIRACFNGVGLLEASHSGRVARHQRNHSCKRQSKVTHHQIQIKIIASSEVDILSNIPAPSTSLVYQNALSAISKNITDKKSHLMDGLSHDIASQMTQQTGTSCRCAAHSQWT